MKHEEEKMSALLNLLRSENYERILFMLKSEYGMEEKEAKEYLNNLNYYVHGVASYVAIGYVDASKKEIMKRVQKVNEGLLKNRKDLQGE